MHKNRSKAPGKWEETLTYGHFYLLGTYYAIKMLSPICGSIQLRTKKTSAQRTTLEKQVFIHRRVLYTKHGIFITTHVPKNRVELLVASLWRRKWLFSSMIQTFNSIFVQENRKWMQHRQFIYNTIHSKPTRFTWDSHL